MPNEKNANFSANQSKDHAPAEARPQGPVVTARDRLEGLDVSPSEPEGRTPNEDGEEE